jgi:hypothetical protein
MGTKEQRISEIHNELTNMLSDLETQAKSDSRLHEVERGLFSSLLRLGFQLLRYYIQLVQQELKMNREPRTTRGFEVYKKGKRSRKYRSIFGMLGIDRTRYYSAQLKKSYYPLDEYLGLPSSSYSYVLDDWLGYGAVEMDFDQGVKLLNRILGQDLSAMQSSRRTYALSTEVDKYYDSSDVEQEPEAYTHLSVGYDGKGIPIRRGETDRAQDSPVSRLAKGKKKDVKREATLSLSSSFTAKKRDPEEVIKALFTTTSSAKASQKQKPHRWHEHKHIRAFLSNKSKAIEYGLEQVLRRDPEGNKPIIVLIDGAPSLENTLKIRLSKMQIEHRVEAYILDFIHLLEYVWKVANAHLGENHSGREDWVKKQARLLLNSQHQKVLKQWNNILQSQRLSNYKKNLLKRSISYLTNRPHMIDYKSYLDKGFPITTGAVESACGHFIKSRMEQNAMHWSKAGAQSMLDIRAVKKNQDWDQYMDFFIQKEQHKLYHAAA